MDHDYLMVVDSSLPGHSAAVERSYEYRVSLDTKAPLEARLRIRYHNTEEPKDEVCRQYEWNLYHCYWNYMRVYVTPMAQDIQMPPVPLHPGALKPVWGYPDASSTTVVRGASTTGPARLTELGAYVVVEPSSMTTVPIQYSLEPRILRSTAPGVYEYRLLVQKQPVMDGDRASVAVQIPGGAELLGTTPEFNSRRGQTLLFDFTVEADTLVVVSFKVAGET